MQNPSFKRKYQGAVERVVPDCQIKLEENLSRRFGDKLFKRPDNAWEYGLTFGVSSQDVKQIFKELRFEDEFAFNMLSDITAVDWLDTREPRFDIVYQLFSLTHGTRLCIKIQVSEDNAKVESVVDLWRSANFLEREVWDMYGVSFENHGDLRRILMYDEFVGHPLRKDYPIRGKQPRIALRVPELRNTSQDMFKEELVSLPVRNRK